METILLVGGRRAAVEAARRLELIPALLAEPGTPASLLRAAERWAVVRFEAAREELRQAAADLLGRRTPCAVVAVTERAVVPAARLRQVYGGPGPTLAAARILRDKVQMKRTLAAAGLPCEEAEPVEEPAQAVAVARRLGYPVVVKARTTSGGRGMAVARTARAVERAVAAIRATPGTGGAALERFISAPEMSVETLSARGETRWANCTEYLRPGWSNLLPARLDEAVGARVRELVVAALRACGVDWGMVHTELFLTGGGPILGEINARPPGGGLMELISRAYGFDAWEVALRCHLGREDALPAMPRLTVGNLFFHPGPGLVERVRGWDEVCALPGVVEAKLRLEPGQQVEPRLGSGQTHGQVVVAGPDADVVATTLERADELLRVTLAKRAPAP